MSRRPAVSLCAAFLLLLAGCAGTEPVVEAPPEPVVEAPAGPALSVAYFDSGGLQFEDVRTDRAQTLRPDASTLAYHDAGPDGRRVAVAYTVADSSMLGIVDLETGALRRVHAAAGPIVYTSAWTPDGERLAFGFYAPGHDGRRGRGGVRIASADGADVTDVGCSASNAAEVWRADGSLVVGDGVNLYVVDASNCRTLHTISLRKKHFATFSPDGERVAYIFRDLVYNRDRRAYEPDSSLYVADYRGQNEEKIAGDRYRARHLRWSPDGERLAFDVRSQEDPALRHVAYYTVATGESTFMVRADEEGIPSESRPVWSPGGDFIALDRTWPGRDVHQKAVRGFADMSLRVVLERPTGESLPATWGWADDAHLILADPDGAKRVVAVDGETVHTVPAGQTLVGVRVGE